MVPHNAVNMKTWTLICSQPSLQRPVLSSRYLLLQSEQILTAPAELLETLLQVRNKILGSGFFASELN